MCISIWQQSTILFVQRADQDKLCYFTLSLSLRSHFYMFATLNTADRDHHPLSHHRLEIAMRLCDTLGEDAFSSKKKVKKMPLCPLQSSSSTRSITTAQQNILPHTPLLPNPKKLSQAIDWCTAMAASIAVALLAAILTPLVVYWLTTRTRKPLPAKLPPGSLGLPVIGQSLGLLRAMRSNTGERWLRDWVSRYGPVSRLSLFGAPTVFVTGPAANKLVFGSDALAPKQPAGRRRQAASDGRGDRGQRHGRPRRRPRHVVRAQDLHDPPPRRRSRHPRRHGPRAGRDRQEQGRRRCADVGGPARHEVHVARGPGDAADDPAHLRQLPASPGGHRGRRLRHPQGVAGVLGVERDAHGPRHLQGPGQVRPVEVRGPGAALLVGGVRRRAAAVRRDRVRQGGDAGDHAPPGEAVPVEALLQGQHLHQGPHAVAAAWPPDRARAHRRPGVSLQEPMLSSNVSRCRPS
ncbi:hypothetical protein PVAP13_2KG448900 [Panicum virgatum]|uniref:Uncharacterized protein n=1 Tax=Panicum virgatum TaxID=38727 RepID=A0A8T0WEV9_PANVG|nr:hypothetical protein PVAP13_2KG448900 [Panicum virgatum]